MQVYNVEGTVTSYFKHQVTAENEDQAEELVREKIESKLKGECEVEFTAIDEEEEWNS